MDAKIDENSRTKEPSMRELLEVFGRMTEGEICSAVAGVVGLFALTFATLGFGGGM